MTEERVLYVVEDGIARITLNRPEALNAVDREMLLALRAALERSVEDSEARAVVLTGAGERAFSAGADIAYLNRATPMEVRELATLAVGVTRRIETLGKPSLAAINGFALGGGLELAESCMLRVAVRGARMGHPEVRIGAVAGWGGTSRLPRLVGRSRAAELLLSGGQVDSDEALRMGLVNRVVERGELWNEARRLLEEVLRNAPRAVWLTWEAMSRGMDVSLGEAARLGADAFSLAASTEDFREGTQAFLEKRKADFKGE